MCKLQYLDFCASLTTVYLMESTKSFLYLHLLNSILNSRSLRSFLVFFPSQSTGTHWVPGSRDWHLALSRTGPLPFTPRKLLFGSLGGEPIAGHCLLSKRLATAAARKLKFSTEGALSRSKIFLALYFLNFQICGSENLSLNYHLIRTSLLDQTICPHWSDLLWLRGENHIAFKARNTVRSKYILSGVSWNAITQDQ